MRPVNLMPPEDRGGSKAPLRTGVVPYVLLGALALALLGIVALTLTNKQISDSKAEKETLDQELAAATARANSLSAFAEFRAVQEERTATVTSLAQSRFDWERVMNELALVIPSDVWLIQLTGTVSPAVQVEGGAEVSIRDSVTGPALEIIGCATSQDAVAGFVSAVEDIDGVTRVGIASTGEASDDAGQQPQAGGAAAAQDSVSDCRTRDFISQFEIVVAFDEVPVPATASVAPGVPAPAAPATGDSSQVSDGQQQIQSSQQSAAQQTSQAQQAANIVPGG
jgi:Tfp pilus assembly protein PilN